MIVINFKICFFDIFINVARIIIGALRLYWRKSGIKREKHPFIIGR